MVALKVAEVEAGIARSYGHCMTMGRLRTHMVRYAFDSRADRKRRSYAFGAVAGFDLSVQEIGTAWTDRWEFCTSLVDMIINVGFRGGALHCEDIVSYPVIQRIVGGSGIHDDCNGKNRYCFKKQAPP